MGGLNQEVNLILKNKVKRRKNMVKKKITSKSGHVIPGPVSDSALKKSIIRQPEHRERAIRQYVELETGSENVVHLEKIVTYNFINGRLDAWDVKTNKDRYWVITNPTNLYSQNDFPSLDYTITFHVGMAMRLMSRESQKPPKEKSFRLEAVWRHWTQATKALENADEAEDFQAVGMRCRECLLSLIKEVSSKDMVPEGQTKPKTGDFLQWSELIANKIARGESAEEIRSYLKAISKSTWQLVNWLTHSSNAVRFDGNLAIEAVEMLLSTFSTALIRYETGVPDRCPKCASYRIILDYRSELNEDKPDVILCEACGWEDTPKHN
jgi:hypothetical protein